jgi:hypothetical protein
MKRVQEPAASYNGDGDMNEDRVTDVGVPCLSCGSCSGSLRPRTAKSASFSGAFIRAKSDIILGQRYLLIHVVMN